MTERQWLHPIRQNAQQLLDDLGIAGPPVPVHRIARHVGAVIVRVPAGGREIDGFLLREDGRVVIGVNQDQAKVRQRFTIAHELGHLRLHEGSPVHVDSGFRVRLRDAVSSQGTNQEEIEANRFAAELLMPVAFLARELEHRAFDLADGSQLTDLARLFGVSAQALAIRLGALGYTSEEGDF